MSSNVPYRLAATLLRTQSSFALVGAATPRYRSGFASLKPVLQENAVRITNLEQGSHSSLAKSSIDQFFSAQKLWISGFGRYSNSGLLRTVREERNFANFSGRIVLAWSDNRGTLGRQQSLRSQLQRETSQDNYIKRRGYSSFSQKGGEKPLNAEQVKTRELRAEKEKQEPLETTVVPNASKHIHIIDRLPYLHRPTKEELLAAATGFWSRLKIRFKWFSIRSVRPFNVDEIGAFLSWFLLGHVLWIVLGTTTFFSLAILAVNTVFAQETLARWVGNYLTKSSGIKIVFESAIVPKWGDGVITFKNVFVSRRPGQGNVKVSKGSSSTAAAAAAAADRARDSEGDRKGALIQEEEDTNYTQFDLSIDTVNVTLSFTKWFNSKGLLRNVEVNGVRGVIDRTHLHYNGQPVDPRSYKHKHNPGDFEIDSFKMVDLSVTVHQPKGFRPFSVSIYTCDLPQLRRQWLFYDFLSANNMSGSFDKSLFTLHQRKMHSQAGSQLSGGAVIKGESNPWKKHSSLRINGLNIDHLNRGVRGPFSWIHEGNVDIVADIMFPADNDESVAKIMSDFYDRMEATVKSDRHPQQVDVAIDTGEVNRSYQSLYSNATKSGTNEDRRFLVMDLRAKLNDVRAKVPIFTKDLSYVNSALIRPIVAYINSRHTFIPINCRVVKRASEFDGSWTIFDSGLMDDLSEETYRAFEKDIMDDQARLRRFRKVGLWSLQIAFQALFLGLAGGFA